MPGRTLGILEFSITLINNGCENIPLLAETQTIFYVCRKIDNCHVNIYGVKNKVNFSSFTTETTNLIYEKLPDVLRKYFVPDNSFLNTSFNNPGMILHCLPVLLNAGWVEKKDVKFKHYYDGISPSIAILLEKLDNERIVVCKALRIDVISVFDWLKYSYSVDGDSLYERIQNVKEYKDVYAIKTLNHRYIYEDVPCGLVPLEELGNTLNIPVPITKMTIDLASSLLNVDFRKAGRNFNNLYINDPFLLVSPITKSSE